MNTKDTIIVYSILKRLVKPFDKWDAYKTGVIDKNGKILITPIERNDKQNASFSKLDLLIRNLKLVLAKMPGGSSKIATMAAAYMLVKEDHEAIEDMEELLKEYISLIEDAPVNSTPFVAGTGDDNSVHLKKMTLKKKMFKRKPI